MFVVKDVFLMILF